MSGLLDHDPVLRAGAPNVVGNIPRLTQNSYREAVSRTMAACQAREGLTDQDMADVLGISAATVGNARNKKGGLGAVAMLALGKSFGSDALGTVLALIGAKAVPAGAVCYAGMGQVPMDFAQVLPLLMETLGDGVCCDRDVRTLDQAGAIDKIIKAAAMLERRRDEVRLHDAV
jgi:hypothetical protein